MQRIAPKPPFATEGPVIDNSIGPAHLGNEVTEIPPRPAEQKAFLGMSGTHQPWFEP
jgi:hypothetical protein